MTVAEYTIEAVESRPFAQNSYVIWRQGRHDALVIDPGFDTQSILEILNTEGLKLAAILNTHGHVDHIAGNQAMKEAFPDAPLLIGRNEAILLRDPGANMAHNWDCRSPVRRPSDWWTTANSSSLRV